MSGAIGSRARLKALEALWRARCLFSLAVLAGALGQPVLAAAAEPASITFVSWGGPYARAQRSAFINAFTEETGITVRMDDYSGGLAQVRAQIEAGDIHWDAIDLERPDVLLGCEEGLLERLGVDALPPAPDGTPASEDYYPQTLSDCGGAGIVYATIFAYHRDAFPAGGPTSIRDFFDVRRFPGRRGLRRSPMTNLEFALMADGVPRDQVYAVLDTPVGKARAFRKLDSIKAHVLWWEATGQPVQMLADREVVMTTAYNGRIFAAQEVEGHSIVPVWRGQVLDSGLIGIIAGTPRLQAATAFLRFASRPERMAALSSYFPYSPSRRSAEALMEATAAGASSGAPQHLPTHPERLAHALWSDSQWWSDHIDEMNEWFSAWLLR